MSRSGEFAVRGWQFGKKAVDFSLRAIYTPSTMGIGPTTPANAATPMAAGPITAQATVQKLEHPTSPACEPSSTSAPILDIGVCAKIAPGIFGNFDKQKVINSFAQKTTDGVFYRTEERPVKATSFDMGFPLLFQPGTTVHIEFAAENRTYEKETTARKAIVARFVFSKPVIGQYIIDGSFMDILQGKKNYKFLQHTSDEIESTVHIPTTFNYDTLEYLLFADESAPKLMVRNINPMNTQGSWQDMPELVCNMFHGVYFKNVDFLTNELEIKTGRCHFHRLSGVVSMMIPEILKKSTDVIPNGANCDKHIPDIASPIQKLIASVVIIDALMANGYSCKESSPTCWDKEDVDKMRKDIMELLPKFAKFFSAHADKIRAAIKTQEGQK